tara:strand:- start:66 stop:293 length:228 start_codon:yes stop_codon:yes gene_type:complete
MFYHEGKTYHFGDSRYEQYKDSTGLGIYSHLDHMDKTRRSNYYKRHSGVETKEQAIKKEMKKGMSPKLLSHIFLW